MSNDDYQHRKFFEKQEPICIEKDEKENCLMSMKFVLFDMSSDKTFCEQLKEQNQQHDKTV